jgi:lipid A disaccharide synthetase
VRVFLIAGEPSGDNLGAALMAGLKALEPGVVFDGIGGPRMAAEGLRSRFPMDELSVMGSPRCCRATATSCGASARRRRRWWRRSRTCW